ncbi:MAG TPA: hypothetical protein VMP01_07515 [Pirellulaceae bacterium]|nr:hypothetical protein [Pirellulaceae bacterium]
MGNSNNRAEWPVYAALVLLAAAAAYVGGYYAMGTHVPALNGASLLRVYPAKWQATVFVPAAKLESVLRGIEVETDVEQ